MAGNASAGKPIAGSQSSSARGGALAWPALLPLGHHGDKPPIPLMRPVTIVGSRQNAHLHLLSRQISKAHALLISFDNQVYIRDLASRTHVYVNGEEVREADLIDGDLVKLGSFTFKFQAAAGMKQRPRPDQTPHAILAVGDGDVSLPVDQRVVLIGRRENCDVSLVEESVSTGHAVLFTMGGNRYVRDLGSRTGTWVNDRKEKQIELKFGDTLRIGETTFRYEPVSAPETAPPEVDEFEDLVGTAPLVDSSLSDATPAAPLPQSFDSSSAQGRAGKAVASDPLAADNLDFDFDLPDEPKKNDTAILPAIEAIAPAPPARPAAARPAPPAQQPAPIPLAGLELDSIPLAAPKVAVPPVPRPSAPIAIAPPHDDGPIPIDIDEPQMLIGDNLLREKLSSSGAGSGLDAAAREALELAGHHRRPASPIAEPSVAKRPPVAPPPAPRAPEPSIPVEEELLSFASEDPIPIHIDEPVLPEVHEAVLPEVHEPALRAAEESEFDIDEPLWPVAEEPAVAEAPFVTEHEEPLIAGDEPAIGFEHEHPVVAHEPAAVPSAFDEPGAARVVEEPIEPLVDEPITAAHHLPLEPVVEEPVAAVGEPFAPETDEHTPAAIHDLADGPIEEPLAIEHEAAWPVDEEPVAEASEFHMPVVEEPIAPLIDEPITTTESHEIPAIAEPMIAEHQHIEPAFEESIAPHVAEPIVEDHQHVPSVVEEPIAPLIDEPITHFDHEYLAGVVDEPIAAPHEPLPLPPLEPVAEIAHEVVAEHVHEHVPAAEAPIAPGVEHETAPPTHELFAEVAAGEPITPAVEEPLALPIDDSAAPSPIETGFERVPDEELLELGDPLPAGAMPVVDDGMLVPLDSSPSTPATQTPPGEAPKRRWFGWLRKPKTAADANQPTVPAPSMRMAPPVPETPQFEPTLADEPASLMPAPIDEMPGDHPADLSSVLEPLAATIEPPHIPPAHEIVAAEAGFTPAVVEEELDLAPFEVSAPAVMEVPAYSPPTHDEAAGEAESASAALEADIAHHLAPEAPTHHGHEFALDELAHDSQSSEAESLDAAAADRHLAIEANLGAPPHEHTAPSVEVVEPAEPTVDSVMDVGHSVGALDLSATAPELAETLSDTAFDLQVEAFAAESLDPIVVSADSSTTAPTAPFPSTHHLDAATLVEPVVAPSPFAATAPPVESPSALETPKVEASHEVLAGGDFQPPDPDQEDDFLFPLDEPTPPTPEAFPSTASFEHGSFAATTPTHHVDEPVAHVTVTPPVAHEPVAMTPAMDLSPPLPIEVEPTIHEPPADVIAPPIDEYIPAHDAPAAFETPHEAPHAATDLPAAAAHSDWDESLTGWDIGSEAEPATSQVPPVAQAPALDLPVPQETPVLGHVDEMHTDVPAIEVEPPAVAHTPVAETDWAHGEDLADLDIPSPTLPDLKIAPPPEAPAHYDAYAEHSFVTEDVTEAYAPTTEHGPSEFDLPAIHPVAEETHAPLELEPALELPPAELPEEQIVDHWAPEELPEAPGHVPPLEQVDSIADLEPSPEDHLAPLEIDEPAAASPVAEDPHDAALVSDPGGAALHPQRPVSGLGMFDLGTDQASFLGGLPLVLQDFHHDHGHPIPEPVAEQPPAAQPAPPEDESGAILDMDFDSLEEPGAPSASTMPAVPAPPTAPIAPLAASLVDEEIPAPDALESSPRKTHLSPSKAPAPGRRQRTKGASTPFGTGTPATDLPPIPHAGFGAPAEIFGGLAASGGTIDVFSQGMTSDLSNDPFFGNTAKEPAKKKRKPIAPPAVQPSAEIQPPPQAPDAGVDPFLASPPVEEAPAEARKPSFSRRTPIAPPPPPPVDEIAEPVLESEYNQPAELTEDDAATPAFVPPADGPFDEDELASHAPSPSFGQPETLVEEEPSSVRVDEQPASARSAMTIPAGHRRRGKGIAILLLLMLLLMAASFAAIYTLLKQRHSNTGRVTFENLDKQPAEQSRIFQVGQVAMLAKPQTQDAARRIFKQDKPNLDYGFLDNVIDFSKNDSPQRAHWSDTNPSELVFRYEGVDPDDGARVQAVLNALCTLDTAIRNESLQADQRRNSLKHEVDLEIQKQDQLLAEKKSLLAVREVGADASKIPLLEQELAAAEQKRRATWEASITADAELKQIEGVHAAPATNPTGSVAGSVAAVAPVDGDLDALQKQMDSATSRLEAARKTAAEQAELSRKSLDAAIEQFQQSMNSVQTMMKDNPELSNYVTTTQRLLETSHQLSSDLLGRQQRMYDDLIELKKAIDSHAEARRKELYSTDKEIKRLKNDLAMHERGLNAALGQGLDAEASQIQKEIDKLFGEVSKRQAELETADPAVRELVGISDQLKGKMLAVRTQLESDRKQSEAKLTELEKNLQNSAEVQKLPEAQKAMAGQLTSRIDALTVARNSYSKSMEDRTAEANAGLQFLEDQVHELALKVEQRKTLLAAHDQEQMTAEQKEKRDSEVAGKRAALVEAMKARADAENVAFEKSKELSSARRAGVDAKTAMASLLGKDDELATLRQSIEQKQEELAAAPPAKPFPRTPVMGETEKLDDPRPLYTAMAWGGIAVVFSALILTVAVRGDRPQSVMPIADSHAYTAAPRGSALA